MAMDLREFLRKEHVIPAAWAGVIAVAGFLGGIAYKAIRGPDEVRVSNGIRPTDTMFVRVAGGTAREDTALLRQLAAITQELHSGRARSSSAAPEHPVNPEPAPNPENLPSASHLAEKPLKLPPTAKGYALGSLAPLARTGCPPLDVASGTIVALSFTLLPSVDSAKFSPTFLRVVRTSPNGLSQVLEQQYELHSGHNILAFAATFPAGTYEVGYGIYRLSDLGEEYPMWYSRRCEVRIL